MPFGPKNAPPFYTAMMRTFKEEWEKLFVTRFFELDHVDGKKTSLSSDNVITFDNHRLTAGSRSIIDDILIC